MTLAWIAGIVVLAAVALLLYWRSREARSPREVIDAERERRRVEARYAALMREAKEIVLLVDRDNKVVEANDYALATYGYSRDDLVGTDIGTFRVPQPGVTAADRTRQLVEAGGHLTFESVHRRSDGVEFPVEVGLSIVAVEGEEYFLEIVRDIGERKAADAALRDSEERYRTVFENATSGFALHEVVLDEAGEPVDFVVLAANPAFETQTGLAVADLVGKRGLDVIPGLAESGLVQRFGRVALTGEAERFEMWASGLGRYLDQQVVSPRRGQFALIVLDITEQRSAEATLNADLERRVRERTDELEAANTELEAANTELEAFSYSVSHDLRAPLRALDGFSLALLEDYGRDLEGDAADYLRRIRAASQRMARLIDDLLMLSRMTRRGMTWERVDLSALARSIGGELGDDDPGRQVVFTVAPKMTAEGDAQLLDVALRNLLGNAWKFTSRTEGAQVDVGTEVHGEERVFFVRDNGAGFDAQYADKLFAPFHRLHGEDEFPGTGIGLATVQRIVRRHGGLVWAEGATGKGATVWFTLGPRGEGE